MKPEISVDRKPYECYDRTRCAKVKNFITGQPVYQLPEGAPVEEMRAMAVRVMHDCLDFKWTAEKPFSYGKMSGGKPRFYNVDPSKVYAGVPYTDGSVSLLHFLQYYDYETGILYGAPYDEFNDRLGNSCSASVVWGCAAVCPHFNSSATYSWTPTHGVHPVKMSLPEDLDDIKLYTTERMLSEAGEQGTYEAYSAVHPADCLLLVTSTRIGNHAMMAIAEPEVTRNPDGTIDPVNSYITVQDQRFREKPEVHDGQSAIYYGRTSAHLSYAYLYKHFYAPFRADDLQDGKTYEKARVWTEGEVRTEKDLEKAVICCNYRAVAIEATLVNPEGVTLYRKKYVTRGAETASGTNKRISGADYAVTDEVRALLNPGRTYTYKIDVLVATGEHFTPVSVSLTKEE